MFPYLYSTYYLIDKIIGKENRERLVTSDIIQPLALSFLRGVNIDNAILIEEEAQNMSKGGIKLLLSRIGFNSKFIISGDIEQSDKFKNYKQSGLWIAYEKLKNIKGVGTLAFEKDEIIRNPIISKILDELNDEIVKTVEIKET